RCTLILPQTTCRGTSCLGILLGSNSPPRVVLGKTLATMDPPFSPQLQHRIRQSVRDGNPAGGWGHDRTGCLHVIHRQGVTVSKHRMSGRHTLGETIHVPVEAAGTSRNPVDRSLLHRLSTRGIGFRVRRADGYNPRYGDLSLPLFFLIEERSMPEVMVRE